MRSGWHCPNLKFEAVPLEVWHQSCCNSHMANKKRVAIRDYNATVDHDFPFGLGDELTVNADGDAATVEDAVWEGQVPHGFYTVTYHLVKTDGQQLELELSDLLKFNRVNRE